MAAGKAKRELKSRLPRPKKPAAVKSVKAGQNESFKTDKAGVVSGMDKPCELTLSILQGAIEGVLIAEKESNKIRYVNASICQMLGYAPEELLSLAIRDIHPAENLQSVLKTFAALNRGEIRMAASIPCRRQDGSVFWADISTARIVIDGTPCLAGFFSDITDRKAARDASEEAQALFSSVFNAVPDILGIQDAQHCMIRYNEAGYRFLNTDPESIKGKKCYNLIGRDEPCAHCATSETYLTKKPARLEKFVESLGVWLEARSYPILDPEGNLKGIVEHLRDITREKRAEEEMLKTEKLESLAILAGGIAHDFNNLLGGIYGYTEMARTACQSPEVNGHLDATLKTMNRAKGLTQQLLTFAKGGTPVRKTSFLDGFLQETTAFASSGSSISCALDIADGLWACAYDANQMGQVIANILINAQQAMPMGGTVFVSASNITIGEGEAHALPAGRYVRISIRDKGIGIPSEILGRIFDPFFTTKQKGSGLGLATSYSIVKQHGGCIEVESEPGEGSVFHIFLPASEPAAAASGARVAAPPQSTGRILIMDDEEVVRDMISAMLQHHGYDTVLAADGAEALRVFDENAKNGTPFSAVILDLTIRGGMGGRETIVEIRKRDPDIPVFVASGYAEDAVVSRPQEYGFTDSIAKPFTRKALIEILCKYL
jgi:PAS domain S-box-containing protein